MVEVYAMLETKFAHFSIQDLSYRSPAIEFFFFITLISGVPRAKHRFSMWLKKGRLYISYSQLTLDNSTGSIQICTFSFIKTCYFIIYFYFTLMSGISNVIHRRVHISNLQLFMDHSTEVFAKKRSGNTNIFELLIKKVDDTCLP